MATIKVKRICSGEYRYSLNNRSVSVSRIPGNIAYNDPDWMWVAVADWSNDLYCDPVERKYIAVEFAMSILKENNNV